MFVHPRAHSLRARDADNVFIIIFNTSRTCSRIYNDNILHYYAFRSRGIVLAISCHIVNENLYCQLVAAAAEAMASGRRHPLRRGPRNAIVDGTRNVVITTIINTHRLYIII